MASFGCVDDAHSSLPRPLVEDILRKYADVLRVGHIDVNGTTIRWDTQDASNEAQLHRFCNALIAAFKNLREAKGFQEDALHEAVYCVCKAVSINYVLSDVLQTVSQRVGEPCSIETCRKDGSSMVSYSVEVLDMQRLQVRMHWHGRGNIFSCNRTTAKKKVRGTISALETEFSLPLLSEFVPTYQLAWKLKRSTIQRIVSTLACSATPRRNRSAGVTASLLGPASHRRGSDMMRSGMTETLLLDAPLRHCGSPKMLPMLSIGSGKSDCTTSTRSTLFRSYRSVGSFGSTLDSDIEEYSDFEDAGRDASI